MGECCLAQKNNISKQNLIMINLKEFINDNDKVHTYAFQQAIDLGSSRGGETVFVPFGEYVLGTVALKDNTNLMFEDGVKIYSVDDLNDFAPDEDISFPLYQDLSHSKYTKAMFYANDISNVKISGKATIDMKSIWDEKNVRAKDGYYRGAKVFAFRKVSNLKLYDVQIFNATDIAVLMGACKNVFISKLYINSHIDGISPDGCENVIISDCNIKTGDDALVLKTSYFDNCKHNCKNINIVNCILSTRANALKLGTESVGDFCHINVSNCVIYDTNHSGIAIESVDGANIYDVNISNISMNNVANPIFIYLADRLKAPENTSVGSISHVNLTNIFYSITDKKYDCVDSWCKNDCSVLGKGITSHYAINKYYPAMIISAIKNAKISSINLSNVFIKAFGGVKVAEKILPNSKIYPECSSFNVPAYGLYCKNVDNLLCNNVTYSLLNPDARPAQIIE